MANDKLLQQMIPVGVWEDRQVAEVVLQPSSLGLKKTEEEF